MSVAAVALVRVVAVAGAIARASVTAVVVAGVATVVRVSVARLSTQFPCSVGRCAVRDGVFRSTRSGALPDQGKRSAKQSNQRIRKLLPNALVALLSISFP